MLRTSTTHVAHGWTRRPPERAGEFTLLLIFLALGVLAPSVAGAVPPVSFAPKTDYAVGIGPYFSALADLNRDGKLDLAVPNSGSNTVSVLLGNGDGTFGSKTDFATGTSPDAIAIGDLNGDGKPDLVVVNFITNFQNGTISVLLGNGDGTFGPKTDYGVLQSPHSVAIADLNADGKLDVVVTNAGAGGSENRLSVFLGNGDGTLGPRTDFATQYSSWWVAIADLNGDGKPDLVTAAHYYNSVSVLLGNGDGTFGPRTDYGTGSSPRTVAIGDLNGDGRLDLAVANAGENTVSVLLGNGDGSFGTKTDFVAGASPYSVSIGDLNGDGKPDLAVSNIGANTASVLLGNGDGTFGTKTDLTTGVFPISLLIGGLDRNGSPDLAVVNESTNTVSIFLNTSGPTIAPQPPTTCITPSHACVAVPVTIARGEVTPLRGFSVDLLLSSNLALCDGNIVEGTYLNSIGGTSFQVVNNGGGSYTVDCAILGVPCGATAPSGTLFTLNLSSSTPSGIGTVSVRSVALRDCSNNPVAGYAGPPASITIDNQVPTAVVLSAAQQKTGNDGDGTTKINLSWTGTVAAGDSVLLYRAGYGHYPEYDLGGAVPATPSYPPGVPWAQAGYVLGPGTSFADEVAWPNRDYWYCVAFVKDPCGNVSPVSNQTTGTLNYFLGDVHDGATDCQGNNRVFTEDISFLGAHYGIMLADPDVLGCLDVGPTTDHSVNGRPVPDDKVNFEDLMIFAMNYNLVSAPGLAATRVAAGADALSLEAPAKVSAGETFAATMWLQGAGDLQGISAQLAWDHMVAVPMSVEAGDLLTSENGVGLSSAPGTVDAALLGSGRGLAGEGVLATVTFQALETGDPKVVIASVDARNVANQPVVVAGAEPAMPTATSFAAAAPNPFGDRTTLSFGLARASDVTLAVYGVDGRKVATLASGVHEAGTYHVTWNGRDGSGQPVGSGLYYARLTTRQGRFTRTLVLIK